ncbi:MAG: UvrD-helicase domain-containing protein, partial [Candidatus Hydrogenedentota bacterium]
MKYTDAQHEAIVTTGKHICVCAGAGSGKTRVLIDRIIHLLKEDKARLSEIVAITFTRKAAAEMRERLREECQKQVPKDDSEETSKWRSILYEIDTARITTIDTFCSGLLRDHGLWVKDDPEFAMMSEAESITLPGQIADRVLNRLANENDASVEHVIRELGMQDALDTITTLLKRPLYQKYLDDYRGLSDEELAKRWHELQRDEMETGFQKYARQAQELDGAIDNDKHRYEQFRSRFVELTRTSDHDDPAWRSDLAELSSFSFRGAKKKDEYDPDAYEELRTFAKEAKRFLQKRFNCWLDVEFNLATASLTRSVAQVFDVVREAYQQHKRDHALKDFSDLLQQSIELLGSDAAIRDRVARSMRYLLIDEFQDTNDAQWALARGLMCTDTQAGPELFIVGDAKQSIYRFRNAQVEVFQQAQQEVDHIIELNTNFRSTPNVMDGINHYFRVGESLSKVASPWVPLETFRDRATGPGFSVLLSEFRKGEKVLAQRQGESGTIARLIRRWSETSTDGEPIEYGDVAILFRKKSQMYLYENELRREGVPFETFGGNRFFFRQEIADLVNALRAVHNPWDEHALLGFLRGPMVGLDDNSIVRLGWNRGLAESVYGDRALPDSIQHERLVQAREWLTRFQNHGTDTAADLIGMIIQETQFEAILLTMPHGQQRVNNVRKILDLAREMSRNGRPHLYQFVRYYEEQTTHKVIEEDAPHYGERSNAVSLMTVHASKGLEFPVVILADMSASANSGSNFSRLAYHDATGVVVVPPTHGDGPKHALAEAMMERNQEEEEAEAARVLYVAMTRAERQLVVSGSIAYEGDDEREYTSFGESSVLASLDEVYEIKAGLSAGVDTLGPNGELHLIPRFSRSDQASTRKTKTEPKSPPALDPTQWARIAPSEEAPNRLSVTRWLDEQFPGPERDETFDLAQHTAMMRGTMTHEYLEEWDFSGDSAPDPNAFLARRYPALVHDETWSDYLAKVAETLRRSELMTILVEGGALARELPFTVQEEGRWISGTIDVMTDSGILIDYKTGVHRSSSLPRYEAQLKLYARAV